MPCRLELDVIEIAQLARAGHLPRQRRVDAPQLVVFEHLLTVGIVASEKILIEDRVVAGHRKPGLVALDGAAPVTRIFVHLDNVGARLEAGVRGQRQRRDTCQKFGFQLVRVVREVEMIRRAGGHDLPAVLIRAGTRDHVVNKAALLTLGRSTTHHEVRFLKPIRVEVVRGDTTRPESAVHIQPVDEIAVLVAAAAHLRVRLQEGFRPSHVNLRHDDAGNDARNRPDIGAIRQHLENIGRQHHLVERRRGIQQRRFRSDDDAFLQRPDFESQIDARRHVGIDDDVALLHTPESLHLRPNAVGA